jgi:hypothetical protein
MHDAANVVSFKRTQATDPSGFGTEDGTMLGCMEGAILGGGNGKLLGISALGGGETGGAAEGEGEDPGEGVIVNGGPCGGTLVPPHAASNERPKHTASGRNNGANLPITRISSIKQNIPHSQMNDE